MIKKWKEEEIRMEESEDANSPPSTDISKIHLHVGQFLPKTNWTLAGGVIYDQDCKGDPHGVE